MPVISSIKDPRIVDARLLASAAGRKKTGKCLALGIEEISWALQARMNVESVFITYDIGQMAPALKSFMRNIPVFNISEGIAKKISDTKYLIPEMAVICMSQSMVAANDFIIVLDKVKDFGNIGTILRTAAAFGIHDFISTDTETDFYNRKTIDSSRGSAFSANLIQNGSPDQVARYLKEKGYFTIATSPHGKQLQSLMKLPRKPIALVIGNETSGISETFDRSADLLVQIPMMDGIESLNAGVAAGISMYEIKMQRILAMLSTLIRSTLGRQLGVAYKLIGTALDLQLQNVSEFNREQSIFMMILHCDGHMTQAQAMLETGFKDEDFESFLRPLQQNNLVSYIDQSNSLQLTRFGEEYLARIWPLFEKSEEAILKGFNEADKLKLDELLQKIHQNCLDIIQSPA